MNIISNTSISDNKIVQAKKIMQELQSELMQKIEQGYGPFLAAIYDDNGQLIAKEANTVINEQCSHNHAEMNAIKSAELKLNTKTAQARKNIRTLNG